MLEALLSVHILKGLRAADLCRAPPEPPGSPESHVLFEQYWVEAGQAALPDPDIPDEFVLTPSVRSHLATLARAVLCAFTYGNVIGCHLGDIPHPDSVSLVADLLLRHERMGWCVVTGVWQGNLYVSLRAMPGRAHAGVVLARILRKIGRAGGRAIPQWAVDK